MEMETLLPDVGENELTIEAFRLRNGLGMNETRMAIKLIFGHGSEDGLDDCLIVVIHDLLRKGGMYSQHQLDIILILVSNSDLIFNHFFFFRKSERLWSFLALA